MNERKSELSVTNVLFCLLVIFIHVSSHPVTYLTKGSLQLAAVYAPWKLASFVVYGFLFLGGIRFSLHPPRAGVNGTLEYYKKRLVRVVIPYVLWVLVYDLWNHFASGAELSFSSCARSVLLGTAASHFYYLVIAIQLYALAPLWRRLKAQSAAVVLPASLALTMLFSRHLPDILASCGYTGEWLNDRVFTSYLFYWLAGIYAGLLYKKFCRFVSTHKAAICVFFALCAVPEVYCTYRGYAYGEWPSFVSELHVLYICAAILFCTMIALAVKDRRLFSSRLFLSVDSCTFSIYLSHLLVMGAWDKFQHSAIPSLSILEAYPIRAAVTYGVTVSLCVAASLLIKLVKSKVRARR